jgi:hypothetical protein
MEGDVTRHLFYYGNVGDDTVSILASARVAQHAQINLGDGNNTFTLDGRADGNLMLTAGSGLDTVDILSSARIAKDAKLKLGDGNNVATVEDEIHRSLQFTVGSGSDSLTVASGAKVFRGAIIKLGGRGSHLHPTHFAARSSAPFAASNGRLVAPSVS